MMSKKKLHNSFEELLNDLRIELAELQARRKEADKLGKSSSYLSLPISNLLNRIAEIEKFQKGLPELSQRLRAWRGNRGLREIAAILQEEYKPNYALPDSFFRTPSASTVSRIEQGHIDATRTTSKEFIEWLEKYLISNAHTYEFVPRKEADFKDFPLYTAYQAGEELGIKGPTFISWAKKAGVKPAGRYPAKNGLGYLYSINQFNAISEFYKQAKAKK
jgi:hypothetical protein